MKGTNDCIAYINKLVSFGTNGNIILSASGAYGNTNYVLDGIRHGGPFPPYEDYSGYTNIVSAATNGLLNSGVSANAILFSDGVEISNIASINPPHPTSATNVAGYVTWGAHSTIGPDYAINGTVTWNGNSGWWIIATVESFNGLREYDAQGTFMKWFAPNAFGGSIYSNTPIGAVTHVDEPTTPGIEKMSIYFGLWASGKNFAVCAWNSRATPYFQAVGDPLIKK